ncbi:MAG: 50S ribosomal protein L44e [Candidatus ainarchaeum sp.]|nr:50S ribosomal protein L44e [Candidatus ainarchaeum sp.]
MKVPKDKEMYCKKCKKHTKHKLKEFKSGKGRSTAHGNVRHEKNTGHGYMGKYKFIATVKKQNKTPAFVAECAVCKAKVPYSLNKRMKKVVQE